MNNQQIWKGHVYAAPPMIDAKNQNHYDSRPQNTWVPYTPSTNMIVFKTLWGLKLYFKLVTRHHTKTI